MARSINEELLRARLSDISDLGSHAPREDDAQQALYLQDWDGDLDKFDFSLQEQAHLAHDLNSNAHDFGDKQRIPEQALLGVHGLAYRSREPSVVPVRQEKYPTKEEWQDIKPIFTKLFINEDKPLNEVKAILERDRNFVATERMYKARSRAWGLRKYLKKAEKARLVRGIKQSKPHGPFLHNGKPIQHRLLRYCKENNISWEDTESTTQHGENQSQRSLAAHNSDISLATRSLQSLFRGHFQLSPHITIYGNMRVNEMTVWNTQAYLSTYFMTGPGSRLYKADQSLEACYNSHDQGSVLVKNEEAWHGTTEPLEVTDGIHEALLALDCGLIDTAFTRLQKHLSFVKTLLEQQLPDLLPSLISILVTVATQASDNSQLARMVCDYILEMATTLLSEAHPITVILYQLSTPSLVAEKCHVWRAVTDVLSNAFDILKKPAWNQHNRLRFISGLKTLGFHDEAEIYLDLNYKPSNVTNIFKDSNYYYQKGDLSSCRGDYVNAELYLRKCFLLNGNFESVPPERTDIRLLGWYRLRTRCSVSLANTLEHMKRIDEAKAVMTQYFEGFRDGYSPGVAHIRVAGCHFDDFLTHHGYIEESMALRAQHPWLLSRNEIPKECL